MKTSHFTLKDIYIGLQIRNVTSNEISIVTGLSDATIEVSNNVDKKAIDSDDTLKVFVSGQYTLNSFNDNFIPITLSEMEEEGSLSTFFNSEYFKDMVRVSIEKSTWDVGKPMIYQNTEGQIVEHWKDGTINILK